MGRAGRIGPAQCAAVVALLATACGGAAPAPSTSTSRLPTRSAPPAAPPSDLQRVDVVAAGVGAYLETTVPVAIITNHSLLHAANGVAVHLSVVSGTAHLGDADVALGTLAPGETTAVAARVAAGASTGETASATARVTSWAPAVPGRAINAGPARFSCPRCSAAGGSGDVTGTLTFTGSTVAVATVTSVCRDAGGVISGAGTQLVAVPRNAASLDVDVPTVVGRPPASCLLFADPGGL